MCQNNKFALCALFALFCTMCHAQSEQELAERMRRESHSRIDGFKAAASDAYQETREEARRIPVALAEQIDKCIEGTVQQRDLLDPEITLLWQIKRIISALGETTISKANSIKDKQNLIDASYKNHCSKEQQALMLYVNCLERFEKVNHIGSVVREAEMIRFYADQLTVLYPKLESCLVNRKNVNISTLHALKNSLLHLFAVLTQRIERLNELATKFIYN